MVGTGELNRDMDRFDHRDDGRLRGGGPVGGSNDLDSFLDAFGPLSADQRSLLMSGMTHAQTLGTNPKFLQTAALYLTTLVLVGDVTAFDDTTWTTLAVLYNRHPDHA